MMRNAKLRYRVGLIGCPPNPRIRWDRGNFERLKDLGFNAVQVNIAWGYRPGGEPLNLEELIDVPERLRGAAAPDWVQSPEQRTKWLLRLHERAGLAREMGFHTIFHFGAPYVGDEGYGDAPPDCLLDDKTSERCIYMLQKFAEEFPEIDDILIYNYDQHSWLCSEFGPCPRCAGVPLAERLIPFLERMKSAWRESHPTGRMWWEPWELSAGQVQQCVTHVDPDGFGLALHCNIAEVMTAIPTDRWVKNTSFLASERGIPVIVEYFLGGPSEEVEPYTHLAHPLVTLRGLKEIARIPNVVGVKEYFGLVPRKEDPNLRITSLFFKEPDLDEEEALGRLAQTYGKASEAMKDFWRLTSQSFELFPWDTSWLIREIGRSQPSHSMTAAFVRGVPWHTPSWMSTRRAIFMKVDMNEEPDPWMLEDVQLRCELAADRMERALAIGRSARSQVPEIFAADFEQNLIELEGMWRRTRAYAYHIRETNLATVMRVYRHRGTDVPDRIVHEMLHVLHADQANQGNHEPLGSAIASLRKDVDAFLNEFFVVVPDEASKGHFSLTSR